MPKVSLTARYVTFVDEAKPSTCYFNKTGYASIDGTTGKRKKALLWFSSPFGPEGGNVLRATLRVKTRQAKGTGAHTLNASLAAKWSLHFGQLRWTTFPGTTGNTAIVSKTGALAKGTEWAFDVTKQLQAVADGQGMYGIVLYSTLADLVSIEGQMGHGLNPTLEVEWTLAPKPPTKLAPAGGRVVGEVKPVLRWDFFDHAGEDNLKSIQVQMSRTSSFTAPAWDSGEINTSRCSLDLSTTSYPGFGTGTLVYWRVRNRDTAGLWSAWSTPAVFKYAPRAVVTLQNPSPLTPFIVDPTPPIDWTVTGGTQERWRVGIYVLDHRGKWGLQDHSGLRAGTDTSWTPAKPLRYRDAKYKVVVDVFDTWDREATPGCPEYTSDSEEVTFKPYADTTSTYKLAAKSTNGTPSVDITWQHTQQPDQWHVYRDGRLMAKYDGDNLLRGSAPNYGITDRWVPQGEHTWKVVAIVNGEAWPSGSVTATVGQTGTWLVNVETQRAVCFVGDTDHDLTLPEDVTVHVPLGATHGVAVTGGRRGYEGTVQGLLVDLSTLPDRLNQNAKVWMENLRDFKLDTGQEYLLLIEDKDLTVQISNVDISGEPGMAGEVWQASLAFREVGPDYWFRR